MTASVDGPRARLLLMVPAVVVLILGITAGLLLLGLRVPTVTERLPDLHAPLMVFGFVGTLISLERAVALRAGWAYAAPLLLVSGAVLTVSPLPLLVGQVLIVVGSGVHLSQYRAIWRRQPATATAIQALGAATALVASIVWSGGVSAAFLVPLLAVFLVLTIAGERLELARVAAPGVVAERVFFGGALALATAAVLTLTAPGVAVPAAGALLIGVAAWLIRFDVARVTVHQRGLPRYVAVNLLLGYGWLIVAGTGWLLGGARTVGPLYDATTHAIFLDHGARASHPAGRSQGADSVSPRALRSRHRLATFPSRPGGHRRCMGQCARGPAGWCRQRRGDRHVRRHRRHRLGDRASP